MGVLSRLERRATSGPTWHPTSGDPVLVALFGGKDTLTGVSVTEDTALNYDVWYDCIRNISEDTAKLPLILYRKLENDGGRVRGTEHSLYPVLHDVFNEEMTAFQGRKTMTGHIASRGNAYAEIEFDEGGRVIGLWPLRPDKTWPERGKDGKIYYKTIIDGQGIVLPFRRVLHIPGFGFDGLVGYSPVTVHRETIGLGLGYQEFKARLLGNNCRPDVIMTYPGALEREAKDNIAVSWEEKHGGLDKKRRVAVLEEGMTIKEVGFSPADAEYVASEDMQATKVCGIFRMPPHKIARLSRATFASVEQQGLEYVTDCLGAWLVLWESEIAFRLLTPKERKVYYAEHLTDALLRGDIVSRYAAYATARQNGLINGNDFRQRENMPRIPAEEGGDAFLVNGNMISVAAAAKASPPGKPAPVAEPDQAASISPAHKLLLERQTAMVLRREEQDILTLARRNPNADDLRLRVDEFFRDHILFAADKLGPAIQASAAMTGQTMLAPGQLAERQVLLQRPAVLACLAEPDPIAALRTHYDARRLTWPGEVADSILSALQS